jgi:hypothetical protein
LDPLQNGGQRGPNGVGTKPDIKEVWDEGSMKRLWDYLTRNATDTTPYSRYDGRMRVLPDGTEIGLPQSAKGWDRLPVWGSDRRRIGLGRSDVPFLGLGVAQGL